MLLAVREAVQWPRLADIITDTKRWAMDNIDAFVSNRVCRVFDAVGRWTGGMPMRRGCRRNVATKGSTRIW